ncbi:MAG: cell division protein FtsZ [Selenomonadaceae bacterium]|nr:cell division protein FtsZ [Selenomonadaceae bacterium]
MASKDAAIRQAIENLRKKENKVNKPADDPSIKRAIVTIKVFGVGGGGNSVLKRIAESNFLNIDLVAVNTDAHALTQMNMGAIKTIQIGEPLTKGRGTGGNVLVGEQAAKNDAARLKNMMLGADMVFITAGMGGGTGTGAAPIIAKLAKELGMLTVGVVTKPFKFEGVRKQRIADEGIVRMQSYMDALITVKNDNLLKLPENKGLSIVDAFHEADSVLRQAIRCIAELILTTGVVNVDFADVTTIFTQSKSSDALLGIGRSNVSAVKAVQQAIQSPLIDKSLKGARGIIFNITGDENISLHDVNEAANYIFSQTEDDVNIILGTVINPKMKGVVQATIIATDFADSLALKSPTIDVPKSKVTVSQGFNLDTPEFPKAQNQDKKGVNFVIPAFSSFKSNKDSDNNKNKNSNTNKNK